MKDSQQITIKARIKSHDRGDLLSRVLQRIYLEDAEILSPINSHLSSDLKVIQTKEPQQATETHGLPQSATDANTTPVQAGEKSDSSATDVTLHPIVIKNLWGFADKSGKIMINPQFDAVADFSEGMATIKLNRRFGFIDRTGRIVINPQFDKAYSFSDGLAGISMSGRWGFIDKTGKVVINPQFDEVESFSGGRARVKNETRIGYIDVTGNYVSNPSN